MKEQAMKPKLKLVCISEMGFCFVIFFEKVDILMEFRTVVEPFEKINC